MYMYCKYVSLVLAIKQYIALAKKKQREQQLKLPKKKRCRQDFPYEGQIMVSIVCLDGVCSSAYYFLPIDSHWQNVSLSMSE